MKGFRLLVSGLFLLSALFLHAQEYSENASCGQVSNVQIVELQSVYVHLTWDCDYTDATFHVFIINPSGDTVDRDEEEWTVQYFRTGLLEPSTTYNYSISVICSEDNIGEPVTGQFTTRPCDTVFSYVKAEAGPTYVDITWDDFPADGQDIYIYHDTYVFITDMWGDTVVQSRYAITPFSWGYLDVNTTYGYGVAVRCSPNVTAKPVTGTFTTGPCPLVSNVDVHVGIDQVQFFWDAGGIKTKYPARLIITHIDGDTVWKYPTTKVGKIIDHLQANTIYQYSLSSSCGHDSLSEPVTGTFTTRPCPTVFNVEVNAGMTDVYITWENTEHSSLTHVMITNVAGDTIMEGEFDDFNAFNEFSSSSFQLEPNTTYLYSIIARCLGGDSEPITGEFTTLPCGQVSNVQTEVGVTDVKLSWSVESGVYGYHVTLKEANGGAIISNPDYYADSIEVSQLKPNTTYTYSILLRCTEAISGEPYTGQFTTLSQPDCGQVSNVSVNAGVNDVTLNWEAPQTEHIGYHVTLSENKPFAGGSDPIVSRDVSDTYFSYSSLHSNTNYVYNISVKCDWGSGSPVKGSFKTLNDVGNAVEKDALSTQIYPNPNTGEATIETMEDVRMEVFSSSGVLLETSDFSAGKHIMRFSSKGVFMIRFSNSSGTTVRRIIVL